MYSLVDTIIENNVGVGDMSKPMSEQVQKLADRYEKATGKKFDEKTNAQKIRGMNDEELAKLLCCTGWRMFEYKECLEWLKQPAEEEKK